jgi:hypothetical protein
MDIGVDTAVDNKIIIKTQDKDFFVVCLLNLRCSEFISTVTTIGSKIII